MRQFRYALSAGLIGAVVLGVAVPRARALDAPMPRAAQPVAEEERTFALALNVKARDPKNAIAPLRKACDGVHMAACAELGNLTDTGQGVTRDVPLAPKRSRCQKQECDGGFKPACKLLGTLKP